MGQPKLDFASDCTPLYKAKILKGFEEGLAQVRECMKYTFVREDLRETLEKTIREQTISIACHDFATEGKKDACAAGGLGSIVIIPRLLADGNKSDTCQLAWPGNLIHEYCHNTSMKIAPGHNSQGEFAAGNDEIYALQKLCFEKTVWNDRERRVPAVVTPSKVACVLRYMDNDVMLRSQYTTPQPIWKPIKEKIAAGKDPCDPLPKEL